MGKASKSEVDYSRGHAGAHCGKVLDDDKVYCRYFISPLSPASNLVPLHSDYDFFGLGLAEGSGLWVGAAHFGASFVGCEHPFDASA